jgi:hypothetical protein
MTPSCLYLVCFDVAGFDEFFPAGICHDKSSPHYEKTKNFTPFNSMDECVKSGGKPPKK